MSRPVILVFADTEEQRDALVGELIEKLQLMERVGDDVPRLRSTCDDYAELRLNSLTSHA